MIVFCVHGTFIDMEAGDKFLQYFFFFISFVLLWLFISRLYLGKYRL